MWRRGGGIPALPRDWGDAGALVPVAGAAPRLERPIVTDATVNGAGSDPQSPSRHQRGRFISGLGIAQIVSWGSLYYSFPLIAGPMGGALGQSKPALYGAATLGMLVSGVASFPIGAAIDKGHGRLIMTLGSVLGGALLMGWALVSSLWAFYLLFAAVGLAQAMTMYEPAFAVVARRYGLESRRGITAITLWGGFASTVFIPLTQWLLDHVGWRDALVVLGACNLVVCVALHGWLIDPARDAPRAAAAGGEGDAQPLAGAAAVRWVIRRPAFWGLLVAFTLYYGMFVGLTFHLYPLLIERGFEISTIIAALAIIGPAQVAGRIAMWVWARERSVRTIGLAAALGFPVCLLALMLLPRSFASVALFAAIYGAANGVMTIVRGLVVPELLTRDAYGAINGAMTLPAKLAAAIAPAATAGLWALFGSYDGVLAAALASSLLGALAFAFASATGGRKPLPAASQG